MGANGDAHTGLKWYLPATPGNDDLCAPCPNGMICDGLNFRKPTTTTTTTTTRLRRTTATKTTKTTTTAAAITTTKRVNVPKTCVSVGDPHLTTFDGARFDSHAVGWKTLYAKGNLKIELEQAKFKTSGAGVAVNRAVWYSTNG